ncbi:protein kinase [Helicosporidium sp. ATCC 50920]|nr:protein kinase [Helicosporidium sp. ATCC 50920]|eukprot:KDD76468.1 protein kinase [Helicosporidium sp. ATCC 50920]
MWGHVAACAFGWVQHARNVETGEEVAIKFIPLGPRFFHRYVEREIMNHRRLGHPHIVGLKEVFLTPQVLGIVMEYVGGGNLQSYVERAGRLPEWQARCFFQQLILALRYCHDALGIAHRDIKLGNILLNTKYQVPILKICDFGYSKSTQYGSVPKTRVGTAAYISPEVALSAGDTAYDTEKADVWSAGVTLFCMLAGRYPFTDADNAVRLRCIQTLGAEQVERALEALPADVSPGCRALLRGVLRVRPEERLALQQVVEDPWFQLYLPDPSRMGAGAPPKDAQGAEEIRGILAQAEVYSKTRAARDDLEGEIIDQDVDDIFNEIEPDTLDRHPHRAQARMD